MLIIGVDPGLHGAVAVLDPTNPQLVEVWKMPTKHHWVGKSGKKGYKKRLDIDSIDLCKRLKVYSDVVLVIVEQAQAAAGWSKPSHRVHHKVPAQQSYGSVASAFKFGKVVGATLAVMDLQGWRVLEVRPVDWKKVMTPDSFGKGQLEGKKESLRRCQELFPKVSLLPTPKCKVPSHDLAESVLLAEYGRRIWQKEQDTIKAEESLLIAECGRLRYQQQQEAKV